jgi:hypothetical protein
LPASRRPAVQTAKCARFSSRSPRDRVPRARLKKIRRSCNASQCSRCSIGVRLCLGGHASATSLPGAACTTAAATIGREPTPRPPFSAGRPQCSR